MEYNRNYKPTVWAEKAWTCGFFYFNKTAWKEVKDWRLERSIPSNLWDW